MTSKIKFSEHFEFSDLASLKVWLDQFKPNELATVLFTDNHLSFHFQTEELSDGSVVNNIRVG